MTDSKLVLMVVLIVAGSLVAAVVGCFAGGMAGYLVARWEKGEPSPTPLPEEWREMPFPEPLPLPPLKWEEPLEGALVAKVEPESPAEKAGIKAATSSPPSMAARSMKTTPSEILFWSMSPRRR